VVGDILQPTHLIFVLVIALLVLGPKRLPEVGRSLGRGLRDFRMAMGGEEPDRHDEIVQQAPATSVAPVEAQPAPASQPMPAPQSPAVAEPEPVPVAQADAVHEAELVHEPEPAEHTS
jgi:sec-independent protein translocase protein TatA